MMKNRLKILVVDDDPMNVTILENILRRDFELKSVTNGQEALEAIRDFPCDMILLDIMMPGMDGYEVCRRVKSDERFRFTKILLVSAMAMLDERLKGYEVGADDYITKPFDENELLAKVQIFKRMKYTEEIDRIKKNLMILFSHETCTPLNSILGYARLLQNNPALGKGEDKYVDHILKSGNELFEFSRKVQLLCDLKEKKEAFTPRVCSLENLINEVLKRLYPKGNEADVYFAFDNRVTGMLRMDAFLMEQALMIVMENAIKFSPQGGQVVVSTEILNGDCIIRVTDQGKGIANDRKGKIFDEFDVGDVMHHQKGQGLGLALARSVAQRHDGSLIVESTQEGSSFVFRLPA